MVIYKNHHDFCIMFVYILFSESLDRYYIGHTNNVFERTAQHNSEYYSNAFTSKANDWSIYWSGRCVDRHQARAIEKHIKNMKNRSFLHNIVRYAEIFS